MCGSNLIILSLPLSWRGWREIEIETERERVAIHVAIGFVMLWFLSLSLPRSPAHSEPPSTPTSSSLSLILHLSLTHTRAPNTLSLSSASLSSSVSPSLSFTRSCAVSSFAVSSNNWLGSGQWVLILLSSVPPASVYCVHLRTTGLAAWLSLTSLYRPGFITIGHPTLLRWAARWDAEGLMG